MSKVKPMNAMSGQVRAPGFYWISLEGQEAEEATWTGDDWFVTGSRTRIVGTVSVLSQRTAALPSSSRENQSTGSNSR